MTKYTLFSAILFLGACTGGNESSTAQMITCSTDPGTGVILSCQPGDDSGDPNSCVDIDEDGDGEPHDEADDDSGHHSSFDGGGSDDGSGGDADDDDDGIDDDRDCDGHPGEDHGGGSVDLPYDIRPALGATTSPIADAFAAKGAQPAQILSVTGATWRITELQAGTPFTVTADDCSHAGNRDVGRDRVVVSWKNTDGSVQADHLDIRYCK